MAENPLSDLKNLPTWGKVALGAGAVGVTYYAYRQHKNAGSSGSNASQIDPVTGLPYSQDNVTDPLTGMTYLSEAQQYGSVQAAEQAVAEGVSGTASGTGGTVLPGPGTGGTVDTGTGFASNAAWSEAAVQGLSELGFSPTQVADALGLYLHSEPMTQQQAQIVYDALSEFGPPPSGTFAVKIKSPTVGSQHGEIAVPDVHGVDVEQATQILRAAGLKPEGPKGVKNVIHEVTGTTPKAGTKVKSGSVVKLEYKSEKEQPKITINKHPIVTPGNPGK